jgi:teichoic acid transport system ATP-binding protein
MEYSGIENVYLNGTMMGYTKEEMDKKIQSIIDFADIGDFINQPVKIYSSGMFARLAFAVAINVDPDILIVDEALAVGDTRFQIKCLDKMKSLKENGTTILFVSHATEQIKRFCNKAIWLKDGKIKSQGESSEIAIYMKTL